ncbi:50S ribosomal protein L17 [Fibrobacterota bacterium]
MRHGVKTAKLGRHRNHRRAMLNNLATSILLKGLVDEQLQRQVKTTLPKAKAVRGLVDRLITYGKKGDLSARRQAARFIKDKNVLQGLFDILGDRYQNRKGGYTRILKVSSRRHGDNAEMAIISLVEDEITPRPKKKSKPKKKPVAKKTKADKIMDENKQAEESGQADSEQAKTVKQKASDTPKASKKAPQAKSEENPDPIESEEKAPKAKPDSTKKTEAKAAKPAKTSDEKTAKEEETKPKKAAKTEEKTDGQVKEKADADSDKKEK